MASWIWNIVRRVWTMIVDYWRHRSEYPLPNLTPHQEKALREEASVIPFENFFNETRMVHLAERGRQDLSIMATYCLKESAKRTWRYLPLRQKHKYFKLAKIARIREEGGADDAVEEEIED